MSKEEKHLECLDAKTVGKAETRFDYLNYGKDDEDD